MRVCHAIALLALLCAAPAGANCYVSGQNVQDGKEPRLARQWDVLLAEGFDAGPGAWKVVSFEGKLAIAPGTDAHSGAGCVSITRAGEPGDSAWELASQPFAVPAGQPFELSFWTRHDQDLRRIAGHKDLYWTQIRWLDAAGQEVGTTPFDLGEAAREWRRQVVAGAVPAKAARAVIRLGFDYPDVPAGSSLLLDDLRFAAYGNPPRRVAEGEVVSRPLRAPEGARLVCRAETPAGTGLRLQVRWAPDRRGAPGEWSAWCGPNGKAGSFFPAAGGALPPARRGSPWLQYRVVLSTQDAVRTPVLREVAFAAGAARVGDTSWEGPDERAPILVRRSPGRVPQGDEPVRFALDDGSGAGVDLSSVEFSLDGRRITDGVRREADGTFRYAPEAPLKPVAMAPGFLRWSTANYEGALAIRRGEPREPWGVPALVIRGPQAQKDTAFALTSPAVPVQEGAAYRLRWWSRHTMALGQAGAKPGTYSTGLTWLDGKGAPLGPPVALDLGPANPRWHQEETAATAPAGAKTARIQFGWDWPDLFGDAEVALADVALEGPHPDLPGALNLHRITISARDLAGNAMSEDAWLLVKPPRKDGLVSLRDDGIALVDGKPFFPIGIYAVWKREHNGNDFDRAFAELREAGFNTAHTYNAGRGPEFEEFYAAAARHGMKLFVACRTGANSRDVETAILDVAAEETQPALLAWYLADDTAGYLGPEELRRVHQAVRDIDPAHITVQADAVGDPKHSRYAEYVASTDGFLPELYPIRSDNPGEVPQIIRDMQTIAADLRRAGTKQKAVWAIVQDFQGWGWPRYPTDAEVRAMTYLAIIHGATGMTYYTYGGWGPNRGATHDPKVWANLKRVAGELAQLHDVLVERDPAERAAAAVTAGAPKDALGFPAISLRLKRHAGKRYLLAANSCADPVAARVRAPGLAGPVEVLFEGRTAAAKGGALEERFEPYAVHVYRW